jgi:hypothetical protein
MVCVERTELFLLGKVEEPSYFLLEVNQAL